MVLTQSGRSDAEKSRADPPPHTDVPDPPAGKPCVSNITCDSLTLSWQEVRRKPAAGITAYIVEIWKASERRWRSESIVFGTNYTVKNLQPMSGYMFRVRAKNAYGISEPGEVTDPVVTKETKTDGNLPFNPRQVKVRKDIVERFYDVTEVVGRGRFATVQRCQEKLSGRLLAARTVRLDTAEQRDKLLREVEMMQQLHHGKLIQLYDAFELDSKITLVQEFLEGGPLMERLLEPNFTLTEREAAIFIQQVCEGLQYMHSQQVAHLDLRPESVMCTDRTGCNIKLRNFGSARHLHPRENIRVRFEAPEFCAPEVVNFGVIWFAADMWSLGVMTYLLLCGVSPFAGKSDLATLRNIIRGNIDMTREGVSKSSEAARDFLRGLLAQSKEARYTIEQCLQHTWLQRDGRVAGKYVVPKQNIKDFMARRKWQKMRAMKQLEAQGSSLQGFSGSRPLGQITRTASVSSIDSGLDKRPEAMLQKSASIQDVTSEKAGYPNGPTAGQHRNRTTLAVPRPPLVKSRTIEGTAPTEPAAPPQLTVVQTKEAAKIEVPKILSTPTSKRAELLPPHAGRPGQLSKSRSFDISSSQPQIQVSQTPSGSQQVPQGHASGLLLKQASADDAFMPSSQDVVTRTTTLPRRERPHSMVIEPAYLPPPQKQRPLSDSGLPSAMVAPISPRGGNISPAKVTVMAGPLRPVQKSGSFEVMGVGRGQTPSPTPAKLTVIASPGPIKSPTGQQFFSRSSDESPGPAPPPKIDQKVPVDVQKPQTDRQLKTPSPKRPRTPSPARVAVTSSPTPTGSPASAEREGHPPSAKVQKSGESLPETKQQRFDKQEKTRQVDAKQQKDTIASRQKARMSPTKLMKQKAVSSRLQKPTFEDPTKPAQPKPEKSKAPPPALTETPPTKPPPPTITQTPPSPGSPSMVSPFTFKKAAIFKDKPSRVAKATDTDVFKDMPPLEKTKPSVSMETKAIPKDTKKKVVLSVPKPVPAAPVSKPSLVQAKPRVQPKTPEVPQTTKEEVSKPTSPALKHVSKVPKTPDEKKEEEKKISRPEVPKMKVSFSVEEKGKVPSGRLAVPKLVKAKSLDDRSTVEARMSKPQLLKKSSSFDAPDDKSPLEIILQMRKGLRPVKKQAARAPLVHSKSVPDELSQITQKIRGMTKGSQEKPAPAKPAATLRKSASLDLPRITVIEKPSLQPITEKPETPPATPPKPKVHVVADRVKIPPSKEAAEAKAPEKFKPLFVRKAEPPAQLKISPHAKKQEEGIKTDQLKEAPSVFQRANLAIFQQAKPLKFKKTPSMEEAEKVEKTKEQRKVPFVELRKVPSLEKRQEEVEKKAKVEKKVSAGTEEQKVAEKVRKELGVGKEPMAAVPKLEKAVPDVKQKKVDERKVPEVARRKEGVEEIKKAPKMEAAAPQEAKRSPEAPLQEAESTRAISTELVSVVITASLQPPEVQPAVPQVEERVVEQPQARPAPLTPAAPVNVAIAKPVVEKAREPLTKPVSPKEEVVKPPPLLLEKMDEVKKVSPKTSPVPKTSPIAKMVPERPPTPPPPSPKKSPVAKMAPGTPQPPVAQPSPPPAQVVTTTQKEPEPAPTQRKEPPELAPKPKPPAFSRVAVMEVAKRTGEVTIMAEEVKKPVAKIEPVPHEGEVKGRLIEEVVATIPEGKRPLARMTSLKRRGSTGSDMSGVSSPADSESEEYYSGTFSESDTESSSYFTAGEDEENAAPVFLKRMLRQTVQEGTTTRFEVVVIGQPKPAVMWLRNNFPIKESEDFQFLQEGNIYCLVLREAYPEDAGLYTCRAINSVDVVSCSAELRVEEELTDEEGEPMVHPEFQQKIRPCEVTEDEPARMDCKVTGVPEPEVTWYKDGVEITQDPEYQFLFEDEESMCLIVPVTSKKHEGLYSCLAGNKLGQVACYARLTVKEKSRRPAHPGPPSFLTTLADVFAVEGSHACFTCTVVGNPDPNIEWLLDSRVLKSTPDFSMSFENDMAKLVLKTAYPEDQGLYTCKASNGYGETSCSARLHVSEEYTLDTTHAMPPKFIHTFHDTDAMEGREVRFDCRIIGIPQPKVAWYLHNREVQDSLEYRIFQANDQHSLVIPEVFPDDEGEVVCKAVNTLGETSCSAELFVDEEEPTITRQSREGGSTTVAAAVGVIPNFVHRLQNCAVSEGETATFQCQITGDPRPKVMWFHKKREVTSARRVKMSYTEECVATLVITSASKGDIGVYACVANSPVGKATCVAKLHVEAQGVTEEDREQTPPRSPHGKPQIKKSRSKEIAPKPPYGKPRVSSRTGTSLILSWNPPPPQQDADSPLSYIIEFRESEDSRWQVKAKNVRETSYLVDRLQDDCVYFFRVSSENDFGVSEPSEESKASNIHEGSDSEDEDVLGRPGLVRQGSVKRRGPPGAPEFLSLPEDCFTLEGATAVFSCMLSTRPAVSTVQWLWMGKVIQESRKHQPVFDARTGESSLTVQSVSLRDMGQYQVKAENQHGAMACSMCLGLAEPPQFEDIMEDVEMYVGETGRLEVRLFGKPFPNITWLKGPEELPSEKRILTTRNEEEVVLTINSAVLSDTGVYTCTAKNIAGEVSCKAQVTVSPVPESTETEDEETCWTKIHTIREQYRIHEELGKGAFGVIKRVTNRKTGKKFAAKYIRYKPHRKADIQREIANMSKLEHAGIVLLAEAFLETKFVVMVMEYVAMGELLEHLVKVPDLCEADIVPYLSQLLGALQYIHSKDIVHLDIKPENILLTKSESGQIKLCDFGLSRQVLPDTPEICRFGTPEFVAPETVAKEPVHLTTDIWSTGVLLYVLLSGVSPFMGNNDKETYTRVKAGRWAFDQKIFNLISNEAKDFITKMLVVDPKKRPTASQCLEDIWIKTPVSKDMAAKISADRLKFFHSRRKWQKSLISVGAPLKMRAISQVLAAAGGSQSLGIKRGPDDSDSPLSSETEENTDIEALTSEADTMESGTDSDHAPSPIPGRRPLQPQPGTAADRSPKKSEKREIPKPPQLVIRRPSLSDSDENPLSPPLSPPLQREWDKPKDQERSPKRRPRSPSPRRGRREEKTEEKEGGKTPGERTLRPPRLRKSRSFEGDRSRSEDKAKTSPKSIKKSDSTEELRKRSKEKPRLMRRSHSADRYLSSRGIELPAKEGENLVHMLRRMASTEKPSQLETLPEDSAEEGPAPGVRRLGSEVRSEGTTRPPPRVLWTVGQEELKTEKKKEEGGMKIPRSSIISGGMRDLDTKERPRLKRGKSAEERLRIGDSRDTEERRRRLKKSGSAEAALTTSSDDEKPRGEVARDDRSRGVRRPGKLRRAISADADISRPLELRKQSSSVRMPEEDSITARQTSLRLIRTESPDGGDATPAGRTLRRSSSEDISRGGVTLLTRGLSVDSATVRRPVRGESLDSSLRPGMWRGRSFDRPKMLSPASIPTRGSGVEEFAPVFREKLKDEAIADGCPVLLTCLPAGSPQPTVQWFKNNELIIESERIKLSSSDDEKHTLHIPQVQLGKDVGVFTCTVSNKLGTASTSCRLHAARPPGKPNPPEVMQVTADAAVVAWEPPITGARDTLLSYILQYRKEGETLWVTVGTDVREEVLLVEGLQPGKSYRFRVACGNRAGYGPFSKSSKRVQTSQEGGPIKVRKVDKRVGLKRSHTIVELQPATDRIMLKDAIPQKQYNFEEDVARGRYAVVKKCVDIITSKEYVSKVIPITPVNRLEKLREYEALSKLRHGKILELHDAFITSKYLILVSEKYYGGDVLRYLTTKPHYSEEEVAQFITQVLEALHYLHTQKIVHLDVKPDNLLLESRRRMDVRLTDFGCARTFPSKTLGELQSTPEFVAPEVVNYETAGPAADIWSVGVLAFLCLSAHSPFLGVGDHQTIMKVSKGRYDISRVFNNATPYCRQFVQDCLVLSPSDRRPSAYYLLNHDWLINTPERRKHRQTAVFPSAKLKAYAEDYRQRRAALTTKEKIEIRPYKHRPETFHRLHHHR